MKLTTLSTALLVAASSMASTSVLAIEGLSANIAASSDYYWRGTTQTAGRSAVSGGIDYETDSGFYLGTWTSNVDFGTSSGSTTATYELDLYGGFAGEVGDVSYDLGYVYFAYPNAMSTEDLNFGEVYANVSFSGLTLGLAVLANAQADGDTSDFGDSTYISADYGFEVSDGLELGLHIGQYDGDFLGQGADYIDYGISLAKDGFTFGLVDTDKDNSDPGFYASYSVDFDL